MLRDAHMDLPGFFSLSMSTGTSVLSRLHCCCLNVISDLAVDVQTNVPKA